MRIRSSLKASDKEYESFKDSVNDSELFFGIDDKVMFGDDEAFDLARSKRPDDDAIFTFIEYLEIIATKTKGFSYKVFLDENGKQDKMLGILWMTATMRRNFELFGSSICIAI